MITLFAARKVAIPKKAAAKPQKKITAIRKTKKITPPKKTIKKPAKKNAINQKPKVVK